MDDDFRINKSPVLLILCHIDFLEVTAAASPNVLASYPDSAKNEIYSLRFHEGGKYHQDRF